MKRALPPPSSPWVSKALRAPAPATAAPSDRCDAELGRAGRRSQPGVVSLLRELGLDPRGLTASGEGPACREGVGSGGPRAGEVVAAEGRRLQEGGVAGVTGGAGVGTEGTGWWETEEDQRRGLSAGLWEQEEAKGGRRGAGGAHGSQGSGGEQRFLKQRGRLAPLPTHSGRFTEPASACLHSPEENLGSQFR